MKTELEIIAMRDDLNVRIKRTDDIAKKYYQDGDMGACEQMRNARMILIAKYNILIEVLK